MSDDELIAYRLNKMEAELAKINDLLDTYQRRIMFAVIGGGALANSPGLLHLATTVLGAP